MNQAFFNFRAVFDDQIDSISNANHQFFADHLRNWYSTLDETPVIKDVIAQLQSGVDIQKFLDEADKTGGSFVGSKRLAWPAERDKRLGMQLLLFREMAEQRIEAWQFAVNYTYAGKGLNENVRELVRQIFLPFVRDLRRYLEQASENSPSIPAADRVVRLNHNSPQYQEAIVALETLERVLRETNDYPDAEEKEQNTAEISAGRRLLQSARVRVAALGLVLGPALEYLTKKFFDVSLGKAAGVAYDAIVALLGSIF